MPTRYLTHRPEDILTTRVFGHVRAVLTHGYVFVIASHGAYLPNLLAPALDWAAAFTGGADCLVDGFAHDEHTDDPGALVLVYPHVSYTPGLGYEAVESRLA